MRKDHKKMEAELDDEYDQIMIIELKFEKESLNEEAGNMIKEFDDEIHVICLRYENRILRKWLNELPLFIF